MTINEIREQLVSIQSDLNMAYTPTREDIKEKVVDSIAMLDLLSRELGEELDRVKGILEAMPQAIVEQFERATGR